MVPHLSQRIRELESLQKTQGILTTIFLKGSFQVDEMIETANEFSTFFSTCANMLDMVISIIEDRNVKTSFSRKIETIKRDFENDVQNLSIDQQSKKELYGYSVSIGVLVSFDNYFQRYILKNSDDHFNESLYQKLLTFHNQHQFRNINDLESLKSASLLSRPFTFEEYGTCYSINVFSLPIANENISVLIKDLFVRAHSIYRKSVAKPVHSSVDSIMSNLYGLSIGSGSGDSLLLKIFSNPKSISMIIKKIKQMSSVYPNNDVLESVSQVIDGNHVHFDSNIQVIHSGLKKQCENLSNRISEKEFNRLLTVMVVVEFSFQFQCYQLKQFLIDNGEMNNWNPLHSEISKTRQKLNLNSLISGNYALLISEFKSVSSSGRVIRIEPFSLEPLGKIVDIQLNEIHEILLSPSPSVSGKRNSSSSIVPCQSIEFVSMNSNEIIGTLLKSSPEELPLLKFDNGICLPGEYSSYQHYVDSLKPLVAEEHKAGLVSDLMEIDGITINESNGKLSGFGNFKMEQFKVLRVEKCHDNSIDVLCEIFITSDKPSSDEIKQHDLLLIKVGSLYAISNVIDKTNIRKNNDKLIQSFTTSLSWSNSTKEIIGKLNSGSNIVPYYVKVSNTISFTRELNALENIEKSILLPFILKPTIEKYNSMVASKYEIPFRLKLHLRSILNQSQMDAVNESLCHSGITLIQGPPGTGKTHTIHAIISTALATDPSLKILVCGPSHVSVDEVAKRVIEKGLIGKSLEQYYPKMVRIGQKDKVSPDVHSIVISDKDVDSQRLAIKGCSIVFSTLSASASQSLSKYFNPSIVIIDESTQSIEPSTIIPLGKLSVRKLILVGDPLQLPPSIFSKVNQSNGLNISLFERLSASAIPVKMLNQQYRMNPIISKFPSNQFYNDKLRNGDSVQHVNYSKDFQSDPYYGALSFYDIVDGKEERSFGKSVYNSYEITMIFTLIVKLVNEYPSTKKLSIGIITPYKLQRKEIENYQIKSFNNLSLDITCNTVDGFQGSEKDIIIFSCVRSKSIGFLQDRRRINVAITRARHGLFIIGNKKLLLKDKTWSSYIQYIQSINGIKSLNSNQVDSLFKKTIKLSSTTTTSSQLYSGLLIDIISKYQCNLMNLKESVLYRLKSVLRSAFPNGQVELFGSFLSGTSLIDSDLDLNFKTSTPISLTTIKRVLESSKYEIKEVRSNATVPIIKFRDIENDINFDLCNNGNMGYYRSSLVKEYTMIDQRCKQLIVLIKIWAKSNGINDSTNGTFSSFCLSNMVIHYLQNCHVPILPNLQQPQQINGNPTTGVPLLKMNTTVDGNIIKYHDWKSLKFKATNNCDIFAILCGFFSYYSKFNYKESIISMEKGILHRNSTIHTQVNSKFILYGQFDNSNNIAPKKFGAILLDEIKRMEYQLNKLIDKPTTNCYNTSNTTMDSIASLFLGSSI